MFAHHSCHDKEKIYALILLMISVFTASCSERKMESLRETDEMNFPPPYSTSKPQNQQQSTVVQVVQPPVIPEEPPEDWMIISIVNCLCLCWLFGIIAIVLSANSRSAAQIGEKAM